MTEFNRRPLVGPAPKIEAPVYKAPFKADGPSVLDANGETAVSVFALHSGDGSYDDRVSFAVYVSKALNARVFGEE